MTTQQCRRQLLISTPLQTREGVLRRTQRHMFLDEVLLESKACTVQTYRLTSDLESSSNPRRCAATQQHMFLDDIRLESKACTVPTNIEITGPVEDVRLTSELESSSNSRRCAATQQPIFLDDVCMESKGCIKQTNIEITVPVENVRLISDLESSSNPRRCAVTHSTARILRQCSPGIEDMYNTNEERNNRTR